LVPVELLLRVTVTELGGFTAVPFPSCVCTVAAEAVQTPALALNGAVVNASLLAVNVTMAVSVMVTVSVESVAVYVTAWAFASVTVKVTTPFESDGPLAAEIVELPAPWASVTVLPVTGLLFASNRVTVIVEVVEPSAITEAGLGFTVDVEALTPAAFTVSVCVGLLVTPPVAAAVITGLPAFVSLYQKLALFAEVPMVTLVVVAPQTLLL
jgi:hypothetical protein